VLFSSVMLGLGLALGGGGVAVAVVVLGLEGSEAFCNIRASSLEGLAAVLVVVVFVSGILCLNRLKLAGMVLCTVYIFNIKGIEKGTGWNGKLS
jgi:hypothetical protein